MLLLFFLVLLLFDLFLLNFFYSLGLESFKDVAEWLDINGRRVGHPARDHLVDAHPARLQRLHLLLDDVLDFALDVVHLLGLGDLGRLAVFVDALRALEQRLEDVG